MRPAYLIAAVVLLAPASVSAQAGNCTAVPELCNLNVTSTIDQPDLAVAIDVVLVGDGFTTGAAFQAVAAGAIANFQSATANLYGRVPGIFNFHVVEVISASSDVSNTDTTDTPLGMRVSGPFIVADAGRMNLAALNAPDVDVVIAIANSGSGRANANYPSQLASGGAVRLSSNTGPITHELGHALFNLADEYEESGLCTNPNELSLLKEPNVTTDAGCFKFAGIAGAACIQGGKYCSNGVFRSASSCLMRSNGGPACPACSLEIDEVLRERRSGLDWAPPWSVASVPGGANPVAGPITLQAVGHDDYYLPMSMAFEVDGAYVGSAPAPFGVGRRNFDSSTLADGTHTLAIFASDLAGHGRPAQPVSFSTANGSNLIAPTIAISSPAQGASLNGPTAISVGASGESADIREIVMSIDGVPTAASFGTPSLFYFWNAGQATPGTHVITARAVDYSENVGLATPINVSTSTSATTSPPPLVVILQPVDGSPVGPYFVLEWQAEGGPVGGTQGGGFLPAALVLDNVLLAPNPLAGQTRSAVIDARSWSLGPHQLRVRVTTPNGLVDSAPVFVVRGVPSMPIAFILSPSNYQAVRGVVPVEVAGADNVALTGIQLLVDGVPAGSTGSARATINWNSAGHTSCVILEALASSSDGGTGRSPPVSVCPDNSPPVVAIGWPTSGSTVPPGPIVVRADVDEVGSGIAQLDLLIDGTSVLTLNQGGGSTAMLGQVGAGNHTLRVTAIDRAGNTGSSANVTITAAACSAGSCNDGDTCTSDRCAPSGACVFVLSANCCTLNADCNDGDACTSDSCAGNSCVHSAVAGCCNHVYDCDDGDLCTADVCSGPGGACSHPATAGCCGVAADCNDGQTCTTDSCLGSPGFCAHDWTPGCCASANDCDDGDPCTAESCSAGACSSTPIANCCRSGADCSDGDSCTYDLCTNHVCANQPITGCCTSPADCPSLNPCSTVGCSARGTCEATPVAGCCNFDFECEDNDPCTVHACSNNVCSLVSPTAGCADAGVPADASPADASDPDAAELDASDPGDAGTSPDTGTATTADAGPMGADAASMDATIGADAVADAGALDAEPSDNGGAPTADSGVMETPADDEGNSGCGCSAARQPHGRAGTWLLAMLALFAVRSLRASVLVKAHDAESEPSTGP